MPCSSESIARNRRPYLDARGGGFTLEGKPTMVAPALTCVLGDEYVDCRSMTDAGLVGTVVIDPELRRLPLDETESRDEVEVRTASGS